MAENPIMLLSIVKDGLASKFLKESRSVGATGGTIIKAEGTICNNLLNLLGLRDIDREVLITLVSSEKEQDIHGHLKKVMKLDKRGNGIVFSVKTTSCCGNKFLKADFEEGEKNMPGYQLMVTIVDRELGDTVVEAARSVGATGATILHGRGVGHHETGSIFNIQIEPEKEIVLMVVENEDADRITSVINDKMNIKEPGKGLLFTLDVNKATGLFAE